MKKAVSIVLILGLMLSLFSGCGSQSANKDHTDPATESPNESQGNDSKESESSQEPVTITIWHDKEDQVAKVLEDALKQLEPQIIIKMEKKNGLTDALKLVGNDPSAAPDMYFFAHDKIGVYAEMGILAPITDFISEETLSNFLPVTTQAATYKGTIYQLPIYYETLLFMYNKAYMSDDEVPKTTEELYTYMKENTKDGRYGFVEQHSTAYYAVPWINSFGGSLISESGEPLLDSEEMIDALNYHKKFLEFMPGESEYSTVNTLFTEGYADSTIGGPWLVPTVREAGIDLGFAAMPMVEATGKCLAPYSGVQGVHVLKIAAETKKDAVQKVLDCICDPKLGADMAKISGCAPANVLSYEEPEVASDDMILMMKQTAESAVPMPNLPEMDVMFVITGNLLVAVNMKGTDVATAASDAQKKAQTLIEAMK